jgi:DNA-binding response OmpR family regulator
MSSLPRGVETVLLVEDEDEVRRIVKTGLGFTGYRVIEARNGADALEAARSHEGEVHLLITDVVMPGMSGRELAERLVAEQAGIRILFMSGYTDDVISSHGIDPSRVAFLQKPFSGSELARKVREVLDRRPPVTR